MKDTKRNELDLTETVLESLRNKYTDIPEDLVIRMIEIEQSHVEDRAAGLRKVSAILEEFVANRGKAHA